MPKRSSEEKIASYQEKIRRLEEKQKRRQSNRINDDSDIENETGKCLTFT